MPRRRPLPADFATYAAVEGNDSLAHRYAAAPDTVRRWRRETGIAVPKTRLIRAAPPGFAAVAPLHTLTELRARYGASIETVHRWLCETGSVSRTVGSPAIFTPEEDKRLLSMRADGMRWYEIADRMGRDSRSCQWRHIALMVDAHTAEPEPAVAPASPAPIVLAEPTPYMAADPARVAAMDGSQRLLAAQLRTGQYFGKQRAEWLKRHGEAA